MLWLVFVKQNYLLYGVWSTDQVKIIIALPFRILWLTLQLVVIPRLRDAQNLATATLVHACVLAGGLRTFLSKIARILP